jgi:hypothetical protein
MKKDISTKELASLIGKSLETAGIEAVLVGGSCVSIYSSNKYQSYDLDYITYENEKKATDVLNKLGFIYDSKKYYVHPKCPYFIEFLAPPIAIGNELIKNVNTIKSRSGVIKLLSPTDCVKDRLSAYFYWNDTQSLEQALLVANDQKIHLKNIEKWAIKEDNIEKFKIFLKGLKS